MELLNFSQDLVLQLLAIGDVAEAFDYDVGHWLCLALRVWVVVVVDVHIVVIDYLDYL